MKNYDYTVRHITYTIAEGTIDKKTHIKWQLISNRLKKVKVPVLDQHNMCQSK